TIDAVVRSVDHLVSNGQWLKCGNKRPALLLELPSARVDHVLDPGAGILGTALRCLYGAKPPRRLEREPTAHTLAGAAGIAPVERPVRQGQQAFVCRLG